MIRRRGKVTTAAPELLDSTAVKSLKKQVQWPTEAPGRLENRPGSSIIAHIAWVCSGVVMLDEVDLVLHPLKSEVGAQFESANLSD
eukprot:scaffold432630_cov47-Prasinocladus_malaysianus.AAC.1